MSGSDLLPDDAPVKLSLLAAAVRDLQEQFGGMMSVVIQNQDDIARLEVAMKDKSASGQGGESQGVPAAPVTHAKPEALPNKPEVFSGTAASEGQEQKPATTNSAFTVEASPSLAAETPKKRGRKCSECKGAGRIQDPQHGPPFGVECPKCAARAAKKNKEASGKRGAPEVVEGRQPEAVGSSGPGLDASPTTPTEGADW